MPVFAKRARDCACVLPPVRCSRLGLTPLSYLWQRDQRSLLAEMVEAGVEARIIKVAGYGTRATVGRTRQVPSSLTPSVTRVVAVWSQDCASTNLGRRSGNCSQSCSRRCVVVQCAARWRGVWLALSLAASDRACVLRARVCRVWVNIQGTECGLNVCGEGGEYETFTTDCPLYKRRIVLCVSTRPPSLCYGWGWNTT